MNKISQMLPNCIPNAQNMKSAYQSRCHQKIASCFSIRHIKRLILLVSRKEFCCYESGADPELDFGGGQHLMPFVVFFMQSFLAQFFVIGNVTA